jgi:hypothetical protein
MQPSSDVSVSARRWMKNAGASARTRNAASSRRADQEEVLQEVWSALQTRLQGVDRATLAIMPEKCHRAASFLD